MNTEIYSVNLYIQSECGKNGPEKLRIHKLLMQQWQQFIQEIIEKREIIYTKCVRYFKNFIYRARITK